MRPNYVIISIYNKISYSLSFIIGHYLKSPCFIHAQLVIAIFIGVKRQSNYKLQTIEVARFNDIMYISCALVELFQNLEVTVYNFQLRR